MLCMEGRNVSIPEIDDVVSQLPPKRAGTIRGVTRTSAQ